MTIWTGDPPSTCDVCGATITVGFADVVIPVSLGGNGSSWGILCETCALVDDVRLGIGRGQYYRRQAADGRFLKVAPVSKM